MTNDPMAFHGFEPDALKFFVRLKKNNDREWFLKNKPVYEEKILAPMKSLVYSLDDRLRQAGIPLRSNAKSPVSRIYRDLRFSPDKRPYQEFVSATLYVGGDKTKPGAVYIYFSPKESFVASAFWQPERPQLAAWRTYMTENPKVFLKVVEKLAAKGWF